ncbi:hypothetical protein HDU86_002209 [Geranomyces michiganensis]|nr:hypothetical protein HDU86_002209 [Geranomyces michiganensis]
MASLPAAAAANPHHRLSLPPPPEEPATIYRPAAENSPRSQRRWSLPLPSEAELANIMPLPAMSRAGSAPTSSSSLQSPNFSRNSYNSISCTSENDTIPTSVRRPPKSRHGEAALGSCKRVLLKASSALSFRPPESLPLKQTLLLLTTVLPEIFIHHMLVPLYPYMTRALLPDEAAHIGYYSGLLQSAYALPTTFMDAIWGNVSDVVGRAPVLMTGLIGYGFGTLLLGMSTSYAVSLCALAATGVFSSNSVVAKGMIGELAQDDDSRAWAYSAYGVAFSSAGVAGTLIGGFLADPNLFEHIPFLRERPYFVACSVGTLLAVVGALVTAHNMFKSRSYCGVTSYTALHDEIEKLDDVGPERAVGQTPPAASVRRHRSRSNIPSFLRAYVDVISPRTATPLLLYASYKLAHSLFNAALPLLASAPISQGGFGLPAKSTSLGMSTLAVTKLLAKALYVPIHRRLGTKWTYCLGCVLIVPASVIAPLFGRVWLWQSMLASAILVGTGEGLCYLSTIMCLTDAVGPRHYGLIHGVAGCLGSALKTVAPLISGAIWELGVEVQAIWLIFVVVAAVATFGVLISARMTPDVRWTEDDDKDGNEEFLI